MRNSLNYLQEFFIWGMFFATSVYGHVALKLASGNSASYDFKKTLHVFTTFWGGTAILAWTLSSFFWTVLLTKNTVVTANTISAFRYVLICLAAVLFLKENMQSRDVIGMVFMTMGVFFLVH